MDRFLRVYIARAMAGNPMLNVNQLTTVATCTAVGVVWLPVSLVRTGTVVVTVLLSAIRGHAEAIYVFSCSD